MEQEPIIGLHVSAEILIPIKKQVAISIFRGRGYNHIYSNIAQGNITFYGAGAYNEIIRTTQVHPHNDLLVEYTKAENIFSNKCLYVKSRLR